MKKKIDFSLKTTLVEQMVEIIMSDLKIASPDTKILPERALAKKYKVSRKTVCEAITCLTNQGLLARRVGKGTFVTEKINKHKDVLVNQLIYTDAFPLSVMEDVLSAINKKKELIAPSFFNGGYRVSDLYYNTIGEMVESQKKLDIISLDEGLLPVFAEHGILEPLDDFLERSSTLKPDCFHPAVLDAFSYKNKLYGVPQTFTTNVLFYNKKLFRDVGIDFPNPSWRWDDLMKAAANLTFIDSETGRNKTFGIGFFQSNINTLMPFIFQNFSPGIDFQAVDLFKRVETREAFRFVYDLVYKEKSCPSFQNDQMMPYTKMFTDEKIAMFIGSYQDYLELECDFEFGIAELPGQKRKATSLPVQGWGICANSSCKNKAFSAIESLLEDDISDEIAEKLKRISARYGHENKKIPGTFINSLEFAHNATKMFPATIEISKAYQSEIYLLFNNFSSPESFCEKMSKYM